MDNFALIDALRDYCETNKYSFIYGNDAYANALIDNKTYLAYDIIVVADFTCQPTIENSKAVEIRYNGILMVGRKTEPSTKSNLDETPIQKYDNRLKELSSLLVDIIGDIACENELQVTGVNMRYDLNKFDLNADFVAANLTFVQ